MYREFTRTRFGEARRFPKIVLKSARERFIRAQGIELSGGRPFRGGFFPPVGSAGMLIPASCGGCMRRLRPVLWLLIVATAALLAFGVAVRWLRPPAAPP